MNLKIEIPFDENTYFKQSMVKWTLVNEKTRKNIKSILIGWTIVFTIGVLSGIEEGQYINGFTVTGTIFLAYGLWTLILLIRGKVKYKRQLTEIAKDFKDHKGDYDLTDIYFRYADNQRDIRLNWETFKSYSIKDNNILLNQNDSFELSYILGQDELGSSNYHELNNFVSDKLKLKEV